jgi:spore photoproduct lyase
MIEYTTQKGQFIKRCPCSPEVVSCGYFNVNLHTGCPYDCSYCILQTYLSSKEPVFFTNFDKLKAELEYVSKTEKYLRIGTGELSDSLAYDTETNYSKQILDIFNKYPDIIFEFKTKSANISNLLKYGNKNNNIVVAWSLNPQSIIDAEEHYTVSLKQRLEALKLVQDQGFMVALHFDPIIFFKAWKDEYRGLIKEISKYLIPSKVAWWSIGALRFPTSLKNHIFKHKNSILFEGELIKGYDGKYRYFKPLRTEMFLYIRQEIEKIISKELPLYLCMEDEEVWNEVIPKIKAEQFEINKYLYESAKKIK